MVHVPFALWVCETNDTQDLAMTLQYIAVKKRRPNTIVNVSPQVNQTHGYKINEFWTFGGKSNVNYVGQSEGLAATCCLYLTLAIAPTPLIYSPHTREFPI